MQSSAVSSRRLRVSLGQHACSSKQGEERDPENGNDHQGELSLPVPVLTNAVSRKRLPSRDEHRRSKRTASNPCPVFAATAPSSMHHGPVSYGLTSIRRRARLPVLHRMTRTLFCHLEFAEVDDFPSILPAAFQSAFAEATVDVTSCCW